MFNFRFLIEADERITSIIKNKKKKNCFYVSTENDALTVKAFSETELKNKVCFLDEQTLNLLFVIDDSARYNNSNSELLVSVRHEKTGFGIITITFVGGFPHVLTNMSEDIFSEDILKVSEINVIAKKTEDNALRTTEVKISDTQSSYVRKEFPASVEFRNLDDATIVPIHLVFRCVDILLLNPFTYVSDASLYNGRELLAVSRSHLAETSTNESKLMEKVHSSLLSRSATFCYTDNKGIINPKKLFCSMDLTSLLKDANGDFSLQGDPKSEFNYKNLISNQELAIRIFVTRARQMLSMTSPEPCFTLPNGESLFTKSFKQYLLMSAKSLLNDVVAIEEFLGSWNPKQSVLSVFRGKAVRCTFGTLVKECSILKDSINVILDNERCSFSDIQMGLFVIFSGFLASVQSHAESVTTSLTERNKEFVSLLDDGLVEEMMVYGCIKRKVSQLSVNESAIRKSFGDLLNKDYTDFYTNYVKSVFQSFFEL